ncbi:STAS domain-containing protein [Pseudonocardia xinjiangensis]|uniref:STAS domain-containing protein n=1 Tax=Pseudonocardia xinjiangensis TaxID=75289 RepID=UPI003D8C82EB
MELRTEDDQTTATVRGEVDLCTAPRFRRRLLRAAHSTRKTLVIDLAETSFLDCAGLAALAGTREALRTENRRW